MDAQFIFFSHFPTKTEFNCYICNVIENFKKYLL